jgi:hypothetical protein
LGSRLIEPPVPTFRAKRGKLKSIVFLNNGQQTSQIGFTTHVFGGVTEGSDTLLTGAIMAEAGMQAVPVNGETRKEIQKTALCRGCFAVRLQTDTRFPRSLRRRRPEVSVADIG